MTRRNVTHGSEIGSEIRGGHLASGFVRLPSAGKPKSPRGEWFSLRPLPIMRRAGAAFASCCGSIIAQLAWSPAGRREHHGGREQSAREAHRLPGRVYIL